MAQRHPVTIDLLSCTDGRVVHQLHVLAEEVLDGFCRFLAGVSVHSARVNWKWRELREYRSSLRQSELEMARLPEYRSSLRERNWKWRELREHRSSLRHSELYRSALRQSELGIAGPSRSSLCQSELEMARPSRIPQCTPPE